MIELLTGILRYTGIKALTFFAFLLPIYLFDVTLIAALTSLALVVGSAPTVYKLIPKN